MPRAPEPRRSFAFGADGSAADDYAWYAKNSNTSAHPVGGKKPNAFGLHDMFGNVWEWVEDPWHQNYIGARRLTDRSGSMKGIRAIGRCAAAHGIFRTPI